MRRYIFLLTLTLSMLIMLSACDEVEGTGATYGAELAYDAAAYQITAQDLAKYVISWQEAYLIKLLYYAQQPTGESDTIEAEWRFMLHDINQDGIPELFLVMYYSGRVEIYAVYGFVDNSAKRLKSNIAGYVNGGIMVPSNDMPGIVRVHTIGMIVVYDMFELFGTVLSNTDNGDVVEEVDSFRINTYPVTEEEFEHMFGSRGDGKWLIKHRITNENIRDVIFGW